MKKRLLSLLLCLIMLAGIVPAGIFNLTASAEGITNTTYRYSDDKQTLFLSWDGISGALTYQITPCRITSDGQEKRLSPLVITIGNESENSGKISYEYDASAFYNNLTVADFQPTVLFKICAFDKYNKQIGDANLAIEAPYSKTLDKIRNINMSGDGTLSFIGVEGAYIYNVYLYKNDDSTLIKNAKTKQTYLDLSAYLTDGDEYKILIEASPENRYGDTLASLSDYYSFKYVNDKSVSGFAEIKENKSICYYGEINYLYYDEYETVTLTYYAWENNKWQLINETEAKNYDYSMLRADISVNGYTGTVTTMDYRYTNEQYPYIATDYDELRTFFNTQRTDSKTRYIKLGKDISTSKKEEFLYTSTSKFDIDLCGYTLSYKQSSLGPTVGPKLLAAEGNGYVRIHDSQRYDSKNKCWVDGKIIYNYSFNGQNTATLYGNITLDSGIIINTAPKYGYGYCGQYLVMNGGTLEAFSPVCYECDNYYPYPKWKYGVFGGNLNVTELSALTVWYDTLSDIGNVKPGYFSLECCKVYNKSENATVHTIFGFEFTTKEVMNIESFAKTAPQDFANLFVSGTQCYIDKADKTADMKKGDCEKYATSDGLSRMGFFGQQLSSEAEFKTEKEITISDDLNFKVTEPKVGKTPDYTVTGVTSSDFNYSLKWKYFDDIYSDNLKTMNSDDTFQSGKYYLAMITLTPKDTWKNIVLGDGKYIYINEILAVNYEDNTYFVFFSPKSIDITLENLSFTVTEPIIGKKPNYTVTGDTKSPYYDVSLTWKYNYQSYNFKEMSANDTFKSGIRYMAVVKLISKDGYNIIREKTQETIINGQSAGWNYYTKEFDAVFYPEDTYYDVYIGHIRVSDTNRKDVLGDGGSVKYYKKGEYSGINPCDGYNYGKYSSVLVLNNLQLESSDFHYSDGVNGQICIADDTSVVLKGTNILYDRCTEAHGIYIASGDIVSVYGDGSLEIDSSYRDYDAIYGVDSSIYFHENVNVSLTGAHAYYCAESTGTDFLLTDNAKVTCLATQTDDGYDYPAIVSPYIYLSGNSELVCQAQYCGSVFSSWCYIDYTNDEYDIKILKTREFQRDGVTPYIPTLGVNVTGGVHESDCRYISIKPKVITGKTVSGTVTSFGEDTQAVTIALYKEGEDTAAYSTTVTGNSASYEIVEVEAGTYTLKVSKAKHTTREYAVTVGTENVTQNAKIMLYGDIDGSGEIDNKDATQIKRYFNSLSNVIESITNEDEKAYLLKVADVNSDSEVDNKDATQIKRFFNSLSSVFDSLD